MSALLETGVDKLISLVNKEEKVSFDLAAKQLGFSPTIIKNWAELLEEEGIIAIEYVFTIPYIVKIKKINEKTKIKEKDQKDLFVVRTKLIENKLKDEESNLIKLKIEFENIQKKINPELNNILQKLGKHQFHVNKKDKSISNVGQSQINYLDKIRNLEEQIEKDNQNLHEHLEEISKTDAKIKKDIIIKSHFHPSFKDAKKVIIEEAKDLEALETKVTHEKLIIEALIKHKISLKPEILSLKNKILKENGKFLKDISKAKQIVNKFENKKQKLFEDIDENDASIQKILELVDKKQKMFSFVDELLKEKEELKKDVKKMDLYSKNGMLDKLKSINVKFKLFRDKTNALR